MKTAFLIEGNKKNPGGYNQVFNSVLCINNLFDKKREAVNEPLEDSFKDLANYGVIGLLVLRDKWDK